MNQNGSSLFEVIEAVLKAASQPLNSQDLYEMPEVAKRAASANRVSDYLGGLWRKGLVLRLPAEKDGKARARWAYVWKGDKTPDLRAVEYVPRVLADRPTLLITEEGNVITVEMPNLIISIRQKPATSGASYMASLKSV